ncbi:unnamed protein product [Spirodela intermedia]|uniref:Uncharacterized protein n=1 Tax=Spirodela intermedia TaxID=51605 RepID=A0A7I8KBQ7_SPIIN|nr:unnamed protein product [Spirodela intermedia]
MNQVLKPSIRNIVVVCFDDILIYSTIEEEHYHHLRYVLTVSQQNKLFINLNKCKFLTSSFIFLGYIGSVDDIKVDEEKIEAIKDCSIMAPITEWMKRENFKWTDAADRSFIQIKEKLSSAPILALSNFDKLFNVEYDASNIVIRAVLSQEGRLAFFYSEKLTLLVDYI